LLLSASHYSIGHLYNGFESCWHSSAVQIDSILCLLHSDPLLSLKCSKAFALELIAEASNKIGVCIILDEDPDISGLYPLDNGKQQHLEDSIPFISEPTDLCLLKQEKMD
jgi:hypothetical protein